MRTSHTSSIEDTQIVQKEQETGARKPPLWETIVLFAHNMEYGRSLSRPIAMATPLGFLGCTPDAIQHPPRSLVVYIRLRRFLPGLSRPWHSAVHRSERISYKFHQTPHEKRAMCLVSGGLCRLQEPDVVGIGWW